MQIGQNNSTSFGIKTINYASPKTKEFFNTGLKHVKNEKLTQMWDEIRQIKPKIGNDVDVLVTKLGINSVYLDYTKNNGTYLLQKVQNDGKVIEPVNLIEAFKNLVAKIDVDRRKF